MVRVSIVIPVHDGERELEACLSALRDSPVAGAEVLVVDDASSDASAAVAARFGAEVVRLPENRGPAEARNQGAERASGEILFFLDADVVPRPGAIERAVATLESTPGLSAVFGSYDDEPRASGVISRYRNLLHHWVHHTGNEEASTFWAACGAIRRAAFDEVGGFDAGRYARPSIEDIELGYRLRRAGHRIRLDPRIQCTHLKRWTLRSMVWTDVFCRARPWSSLIFESGHAPKDLNLRGDQKASVALVGLAGLLVAASVLEPALLGLAAAALAGVIVLNRAWFAFLVRRRGLGFAAACVPLHLLYFVSSGVGYTLAWIDFRLRRPVPAPAARSRLSREPS